MPLKAASRLPALRLVTCPSSSGVRYCAIPLSPLPSSDMTRSPPQVPTWRAAAPSPAPAKPTLAAAAPGGPANCDRNDVSSPNACVGRGSAVEGTLPVSGRPGKGGGFSPLRMEAQASETQPTASVAAPPAACAGLGPRSGMNVSGLGVSALAPGASPTLYALPAVTGPPSCRETTPLVASFDCPPSVPP